MRDLLSIVVVIVVDDFAVGEKEKALSRCLSFVRWNAKCEMRNR